MKMSEIITIVDFSEEDETLIVQVPEDKLDRINRVILQTKHWSKTMYSDSQSKQPIKGRWTKVSENSLLSVYSCSRCNCFVYETSPFCPHCGSSMEEKKYE